MNILNENYYVSIDDIILKNWWKAQNGEKKYCRKNLAIGTEEEDDEAWILVHDSYLEEFGIGSEFERILAIRKELGLLQCELVLTDDAYLRNQIKRLQFELKEILERPVNMDIDGMVIHLEKWLGFRINETEVTARKFYKIVREYERSIEMMNKR